MNAPLLSMRVLEATQPTKFVRWHPTTIDEHRAQLNHGQSLTRLNARGGVSWCELLAILQNRPWRAVGADDAMRAVFAELQRRDRARERAL